MECNQRIERFVVSRGFSLLDNILSVINFIMNLGTGTGILI